MVGTILYPLNQLKDLYQDIYEDQVKKYDGREKLLTTEIPPLKCLWNDVLHFTAVSPQELKDNLAKADIQLDPISWFKIPVSTIVGGESVAFTYRRDQDVVPNFKEYEIFDPKKMETYKVVPKETIEYYKQKKVEGVRPLLFHLVPHVLYKGNIDTDGLEIITV